MAIHFTTQPYGGDGDLMRLRRHLMAWRADGRANVYWHAGDLAWRMFLVSNHNDLRANVRQWTAGDDVLGFAMFDASNGGCDLQLAPDVWAHARGGDTALADEVVAWLEARRQEQARERGKPFPPLWLGAAEHDADRIALLERHGFACGEGCLTQMERALSGPIPAMALPDGFALRAVAGDHEHAARAAVHRAAFNSTGITAEAYLRLMRSPAYARDLDLVAVAPSGAFASFCLCWLDEVNQVGEFEPVGTHPDFRRRGLAQAALLEGLRRMQAHGMATALVLSDEPGPQRLYESVGFRAIYREFDYVRKSGYEHHSPLAE